MEVCPEAGVVMQQMADRLSQDGGMALLADYGHSGEKTDTFRVNIIFLPFFSIEFGGLCRRHYVHFKLDDFD